MGEAGSELVRERHSQPKHLEKLENLYEELRPGNSRRRTLMNARPLRVAYIGGRGVGGKYSGIETYYEETGKRLARNGHEVTAYCRSHFTPSTAVHDGIRIVRLPTIRFKHLETFVHTLLSTIHACFSNYDVVHYQCPGTIGIFVSPPAVWEENSCYGPGSGLAAKKMGPAGEELFEICRMGVGAFS